MEGSPLAVFDCMVFLQGTARRDSPSAACLRLFASGHITLCVSQTVLAEVEEVLSRPKLRRKFSTLTTETVGRLVDDLRRKAIFFFAEVPASLRYGRDPKDEPYLNLVLASRAQYLVTWDNDILDLEAPTTSEGRALRRSLPGLRILDPVAFLRELSPQK